MAGLAATGGALDGKGDKGAMHGTAGNGKVDVIDGLIEHEGKNGMDENKVMQYEENKKILRMLEDIQTKSAPIELSIGWVDKGNIVQREIVIKSAPPVVARELIEEGYCLDITPEGVIVYKI